MMVNNAKGANQPASAERTVGAMLARAVAIGQQIEQIAGDIGLQRLGKPSWLRDCLTLGDFATVEDLEAARAKLDGTPYLRFEVEQAAQHWIRDRQDCVAIWHGFEDGRDARAPAYAERIMLPMSVPQASAIAAFVAGERAPDAFFGRLNDRDEPERMLSPLYEEAGELDRRLAIDLRVRDVHWTDGKGVVTAGGVAIVLDQSTVGAVASFIAKAARDVAIGLKQAA